MTRPAYTPIPFGERVYRQFAPVIECARRYRDAESDSSWREARRALAVAIVAWWHRLPPPDREIVVLNLPVRHACPVWRRVVDAAIELPDDTSETRSGSAAYARLFAACLAWAPVAVWRDRTPRRTLLAAGVAA